MSKAYYKYHDRLVNSFSYKFHEKMQLKCDTRLLLSLLL